MERVLKLPDDPNVQHWRLTRTSKDRHRCYPQCTGGMLGLREVKLLSRGQRANGRDGTGWRWLPACLGSRLPVRPRGFRLAWELVSFSWEDSSSKALGLGLLQVTEHEGVTSTCPASGSSHWKGMPFGEGHLNFEVKCYIITRNRKY